MKKLTILLALVIALMMLTGCSGEQIGDIVETETQTCTTTMEYKWIWSIFEDSGFRKVPVTYCKTK